MTKLITVEIKGGEPFHDGDTTITPFNKVLRLQLPGWQGGLIWNRPTSILVQSGSGKEQVIPVPDVTRQVQWSLLVASLLSTFFFWQFFRIKRQDSGSEQEIIS
jgi:hypothetical protein